MNGHTNSNWQKGRENWQKGRESVGKRGFTVVDLGTGCYKVMKYTVGDRDSIQTDFFTKLDDAIAHGKENVEYCYRHIDVTADCTFEVMPLMGLNHNVVVIMHEGRKVNPFPGGDYSLEGGKVFKKKKYYGV